LPLAPLALVPRMRITTALSRRVYRQQPAGSDACGRLAAAADVHSGCDRAG
jgi:hypothetical protein